MVEISDCAFGGLSTQGKLRLTTEQFREAVVEVSDTENNSSSASQAGRAAVLAAMPGMGWRAVMRVEAVLVEAVSGE